MRLLFPVLIFLFISGCSNPLVDGDIISPGEDIVPIIELLEISNLPNVTAYEKNDTLDLSGLILKYVYSDGTKKVVDEYDTYPIDGESLLNSGKKTIKVSSGGFVENFTIDILCDVGDIYYIDDQIIGVVFQVNSNRKTGYMVSVDEEYLSWTTPSSVGYDLYTNLTDNDGLFNHGVFVNYSDWSYTNYPASFWCNSSTRGSNSGGFTDWYIPASSEMSDLVSVQGEINSALSLIPGSTQFNESGSFTKRYWTTRPTDMYNFWTYYNGWSVHSKSSMAYVRAIKQF